MIRVSERVAESCVVRSLKHSVFVCLTQLQVNGEMVQRVMKWLDLHRYSLTVKLGIQIPYSWKYWRGIIFGGLADLLSHRQY